jgi:hypothetical protein
LPGNVGLECQGSACPALNAGERDRLRHDLRAVIPVGQGRQLQFGAIYTWENGADPNGGSDATQLYGGLRWQW